MSLKFGFGAPKTKKPLNVAQRPAPVKRKPAFGGDDSDDEDAAAATKSAGNGVEEEVITTFDEDELKAKAAAIPKKAQSPINPTKLQSAGPPTLKAKKDLPVSQYGDLSSQLTHKKHEQEATELDPTIYDYDAAYDAIKAKENAAKAAEKADAEARKPKYMEALVAAAEVRKRDELRAKDKLLQREREQEGDEFADKEKFVTGAYKAQQEEVRRLEEEEKKKEEAEAKKGRGMQGFYRNMMDREDKKHQEAVEAALHAKPGEAAPVDERPKEKTDAELAKELNAQGANIVLNEDGEVADKRQLLKAGLNVAPKPKSVSNAPKAEAPVKQAQPAYQGRNAAQRATRERQSKMMEEQLAESAKRAADDEAEEQRKLEHASKSRKTESDVMSAKERYLARKAAAAAEKGK